MICGAAGRDVRSAGRWRRKAPESCPWYQAEDTRRMPVPQDVRWRVMKRWVANVLAGVLLVMSLGMCVLWVRSFEESHSVVWGRRVKGDGQDRVTVEIGRASCRERV